MVAAPDFHAIHEGHAYEISHEWNEQGLYRDQGYSTLKENADMQLLGWHFRYASR